ncbi:hypothetical protein BDP81DRAFT_56355 [Colletotrichum phormii]|uniref:Uncharacterized protein n=1 Tax=Colletotrichum phormii TaxID=359342 RepID=A0AAI9ZNQ5_9PEZI|nr:uncharacterized protein BDP81DRAFT_56355 [Colletotrichum phormii]KAK1634263.1 hypothetical protein BDP81DRAFT_56355 [Colletotrichum phormii]
MLESARWKLEQGGSLGSLEQLMESRTVGSTLWTIIQFRIVNLLAAGLVFVWTFSPLGAQAILRMLNSLNRSDNYPAKMVFFDNLSRSWFASMVSVGGISGGANRVDVWGNLRIPIMDSTHLWSGSPSATPTPEMQHSHLSPVILILSVQKPTAFPLRNSIGHTHGPT